MKNKYPQPKDPSGLNIWNVLGAIAFVLVLCGLVIWINNLSGNGL